MTRLSRLRVVHGSLLLFAVAIIGKSAQVQLGQGRTWRQRAAHQQYEQRPVPGPRGALLDADGGVLASDRPMVRLAVAPREVGEPDGLRAALHAAGVPASVALRVLRSDRPWVSLPGAYPVAQAAAAVRLRGVYATPVSERTYTIAADEGLRALLGHVDVNGNGVDGIELTLDSLIHGVTGSTVSVRDVRGRAFDSPAVPAVESHAGNTVVLTINHELQEIADHALASAVSRAGVLGGDVLILDPRTGDILAMASRHAGAGVSAATPLTEPFEPGSTMKPFIAATLLQLRRITASDSVDTGHGILVLAGRRIHDEHLVGKAPLSDVIRWSSNVGIVKFAQRLTPREEYDGLRDFGFGTSTGVPYSAEAPGTLRDPSHWSQQSGASVAIGYEIAATPLQLALGYAVFANGGELLEPGLVREIRTPDGRVLYRRTPRVVRRVVRPDVAARVRAMLRNVVADGTALQADISNFPVAGKTGTPRAVVHGHYVSMRYNPNFVGLFPGDAPQYVVVAKLRVSQGNYFAASTAAPLTRSILEAALAARDVALDRSALAVGDRAATAGDQRLDSGGSPQLVASQSGASTAGARVPGAERASPQDVDLATRVDSAPSPRSAAELAVPDVAGLPLRAAVRTLHASGFRVRLVHGLVAGTSPPAGAQVAGGTVIRLAYPF